jgi:hypothetical protein
MESTILSKKSKILKTLLRSNLALKIDRLIKITFTIKEVYQEEKEEVVYHLIQILRHLQNLLIG